jgi:hypothetical protein
MESCFNGRQCPVHVVPAATDSEWEQSLKEAAAKLVCTDPGTTVGARAGLQGDGMPRPAPGSVMDLAAVITTTRRDRDRDIMDLSGARGDSVAVLLRQHVPMLPIGRPLCVADKLVVDHLASRFVIDSTFVIQPVSQR